MHTCQLTLRLSQLFRGEGLAAFVPGRVRLRWPSDLTEPFPGEIAELDQLAGDHYASRR